MNTDLRPPSRRVRCTSLFLSACVMLPWALLAEDKPAPRAPDRQELWVPTKHWQQVLSQHPNAVLLTPEQYEALVRDAGKIAPEKPDEHLPAPAVVESLRFRASATDESAELLTMDGELTLRCLTDEWTEVTAHLPFRHLASATVDGNVVLGLAEEVKTRDSIATQRKLLVRGKGEHRISLRVLGRPGTSSLANTRSLAFHTIDSPSVLDLQLPPNAIITQATASYTREGDIAHVLLQAPGAAQLRSLAWTTSSTITQVAKQESATSLTTITDHSIESQWTLAIQRSATDTSNHLLFDVVPADAVVLSFEGDGVTHWQQDGAKLDVTMRDRTHSLAVIARLQSVIDLQSSTQPQSLALPALRFQGQHAKDLEARIASIAEGVTLMEYQGASPALDGALHWNPVRDTVKLLLRKADPRVVVDADAHVRVTLDDVLIDRTLMVNTDRPVTELRLTLPAGEEFLSTVSNKGPAMEWKRIGQIIEYRWASPLTSLLPSVLKLSTRKRLNTAAPSNSITLESLAIADAKKQAGYMALDFDPTWRVAVKSASGLEERDARSTPVTGKMAWFGLRTYQLAFDVQRREPIYDASITSYALPRAKTVEIEGQVTLDVTDAPLRQFKVTFDKLSAPLVRFTSPLIGEQQLDAATGIWSLTLRKESMGRVPLRFRVSLPSAPAAGTETISAALPTVQLTSARRQHGVWVIEANTDTELTFDPKAMQPLDVLRAPAMEDYQPRHRLIAAFDYATPEATLTLHAARHGHSELAALIIHQLRLTTVLSHDGSARHDALYELHHSGEQFLNVQLPPAAQLLSALAAGHPVKPVRGPDGTISVPLPADSANQSSVAIRLLYETSDAAWTSGGQRQLLPPTIPNTVPVLATDWQVFVPHGYGFKKVDTELVQEGTGMEAGSMILPSVSPAEVSFFPGGAEAAGRRPRSRMLNQVTEAWEDKVPITSTAEATLSRAEPINEALGKLRTIKLPTLQLKDATIGEAVEFLRTKSRDLDASESDASRKGVNLILKSDDPPSTARITLDLKNVPMEEALRYVTELAGMKYKVEPQGIVIVPVTESTTEQYTRVYKVPPDFLSLATDVSSGAAAAPADPFAAPTPAPKTALAGRMSAKDMLIAQGIPFPEGAAAVFNPVTNQLIVKNTAPNLDLVESAKNSLLGKKSDRQELERLDRPLLRSVGKVGLLPLELDLPTAGHRLHFHGPQAPSALVLSYVSAERQMFEALLLMLAGATLFVAWGRQRPFLWTLLVFVVVVLGTGLIQPDWQRLANALFLGWLIALVLTGLWKFIKAFELGLQEGGKV